MWAFLLAAFIGTAAPSTIAVDYAVHCGATKASFGVSLGAVSQRGEKMHMRSLESIAAITTPQMDVSGWVAWDNEGHPWIQFASNGNQLKAAMAGKYIQFAPTSAFSPMKADSFSPPPGFQLLACPFVPQVPQ